MQFAVTTEQQRFFEEKGAIQLLDFLSEAQQGTLQAGVKESLRYKLGENWEQESPDELFVEGHDLHLDHPALCRLLAHRRFGALAAELYRKTPIRLGYDQLLPACKKGSASSYKEYLMSGKTFKELSCVQGILGGIIFCINPPSPQGEDTFFPKRTSDVTFFSADLVLPLPYLMGLNDGSFLISTIVEEVAIYIMNEGDPHVHALKRWGYVFGDKLKSPYYPIIYR